MLIISSNWKVTALVWLCWRWGRTVASPKALTRIYHITELLGRWSMVDIFVVSILACLVRMGTVLNILPGPARAFLCRRGHLLTMFAAMSFDPAAS